MIYTINSNHKTKTYGLIKTSSPYVFLCVSIAFNVQNGIMKKMGRNELTNRIKSTFTLQISVERTRSMRKLEHSVDFCVVGGGIAGLCAAVAAARNGVKVALMQDRPVLGGNASSEIRMWICGANGRYDRETGIVEELFLENYYRNTGLSYSVWDSVLYEKARFEPNITLLMNCSCNESEMDGDTIVSVTGWQLTSETYHTVKAKYFADCSGDSILAPLTGAEFLLGREAKSEYNETIPPDVADKKTMGQSLLLMPREHSSPRKFIPPEWAYSYPTHDQLGVRDHDLRTNYWWIELGGDRDSIHDTEELKDELLKIAFGVWDHVKNHGDHGAENWELDWLGFLPGKRESRRYVGDYVLNQNDVENSGHFDDNVAYGGWSMDDHFPEGFNYKNGYPTIFHPAPSPWGIPFRCLYSKNISNLLFAGRNISVTHSALSSSRVMATCGIIGQAAGTGAALAVKSEKALRDLDINELQQTLLNDDCYIPRIERVRTPLTEIAKTAAVQLKSGIDRNFENIDSRHMVKRGEKIEYAYDSYVYIEGIRLIFDSNLTRDYNNMPQNYPLIQPKYKLPETLVRSYKIVAHTPDGDVTIADVKNNRQRLNKHSVNMKADKITLIPAETWGAEVCAVFAMDIY